MSLTVNEPDPFIGNDAASRLVRWADAAQAAHALAQSLCGTRFVPEIFQGEAKVGDATAAILLGAEVGLSPIGALRSVYIIKGVPAMYTRTMVGLALAHGHRIWTEAEADDSVTVAGQRAGSDRIERSTWTQTRVKVAGLTRNAQYVSNPRAMLWARAAGDVARRVAPDVLLGIPETNDTEPEPETSDAPPVTVQRRRATRATVTSAPSGRDEPTPRPEVPIPIPDPIPDEGDEGEQDTQDGEPGEPLMTGPQRARLHAEFNAAGLSRVEYIAWVGEKVGREITTTNELTVTEAGFLIDIIENVKAARAGEAAAEGTRERADVDG